VARGRRVGEPAARAATRPPPAWVVAEQAGTSYPRLLDEVRQQAARQPLEDTQLEAGEIAFVPGFEELNSFKRAFRGSEGTTPARWRAAQARAS
jgi:transcriptional regulator GlxA family with amidase domain